MMGVFDILSLAVLGLFIFIGIKKGLIHELLYLAVVLLAFVVAYFLTPMITDMVEKFVTTDKNISRISFVVCFAITLSVVTLFAGKIIDTIGLFGNMGKILRILGGVAALFRGVVYVGMVLWFVTAVAPASSVSHQINGGVVTSNIKMAVSVSYEKVDSIIRKNNIKPPVDIGN